MLTCGGYMRLAVLCCETYSDQRDVQVPERDAMRGAGQ